MQDHSVNSIPENAVRHINWSVHLLNLISMNMADEKLGFSGTLGQLITF